MSADYFIVIAIGLFAAVHVFWGITECLFHSSRAAGIFADATTLAAFGTCAVLYCII